MARATVYLATVMWLGTSAIVNVIESERDIPLIGTDLLWGGSMAIEWEFGGLLTVTPLPRTQT